MNWKEFLKPTKPKVINAIAAIIVAFFIMAGCFGAPSPICKIFISDLHYWTTIIWFPILVYIVVSIITYFINKSKQ